MSEKDDNNDVIMSQAEKVLQKALLADLCKAQAVPGSRLDGIQNARVTFYEEDANEEDAPRLILLVSIQGSADAFPADGHVTFCYDYLVNPKEGKEEMRAYRDMEGSIRDEIQRGEDYWPDGNCFEEVHYTVLVDEQKLKEFVKKNDDLTSSGTSSPNHDDISCMAAEIKFQADYPSQTPGAAAASDPTSPDSSGPVRKVKSKEARFRVY